MGKRVRLKQLSDTPKGSWSVLMSSRFSGCELLHVSKHFAANGGHFKVYWIGTTSVVGTIDPQGACQISPATARYFGSACPDIERLVGEASVGVFPSPRVPLLVEGKVEKAPKVKKKLAKRKGQSDGKRCKRN